MAEEKKKPEPILHKHAKAKTKDLITIVKNWNANTDAAAQKRADAQYEMTTIQRGLTDAQYKYIKNFGGKTVDLKKDDIYVHSHGLLNEILLEGIKKERGEEAAKLYKSNPHMLKEYANERLRGHGLSYDHVRDDIVENRRNLDGSKRLATLKQVLAQHGVKADQDVRHATTELITNTGHHKALEDEIKKSGLEVDPTEDMQTKLGLYTQHLAGHTGSSDYRESISDKAKYKAPKK